MTNIELIKALVKAQLEIKPPVKDKRNPMFKSDYASLDAIYDACRLVLAKNGLILSHNVEKVDGTLMLVTILRHISGEFIENKMPMFIDKQTSQGFGSALTYSRRYSVCSLLSLPSDEDDDGNAAEKVTQDHIKEIEKIMEKTLNDEQIEHIDLLIEDDMELLNRILNGYKVHKLNEIPAKHFKAIVSKLEAKKDTR